MSLAALAIEHGSTAGQLALALGVDPLLLVRIDQGRQPLTRLLARNIGIILGVEIGEVLDAAKIVTDLEGGLFFKPLPPVLGDTFRQAMIAPTREIPPPSHAPAELWVFSLVGTSGSAIAEAHSLANGALIVANALNTNPALIPPLPISGLFGVEGQPGVIWMSGTDTGATRAFVARINRALGTITDIFHFAAAPPLIATLASNGANVWGADFLGMTLLRFNPSTFPSAPDVTVSTAPANCYRVRFGRDGFLYACGLSLGPDKLWVFKVSPAGLVVASNSLATTITGTADITDFIFDATGNLYTPDPHDFTRIVRWAAGTLATTAIPLSAAFEVKPGFCTRAPTGKMWVTGNAIPSRVWEVALNGTRGATIVTPPADQANEPVTDGQSVFAAIASAGNSRYLKINPNTAAFVEVPTGAGPGPIGTNSVPLGLALA